ncbi:phosphomevalonate kinase [Gurleya vavrai]
MTNLIGENITSYETKIPGKIIINGGYLVLFNANKCIAIVPNDYSTLKIVKCASENFTLQIETNFLEKATFLYENKKFISYDHLEPVMDYILKIIQYFFEIRNIIPKQSIKMTINLSDSLFSEKANLIKESIKTGLGSSCVFLIGIVDALLDKKMQKNDFLNLCLEINKRLSPFSSGCDISACINGSQIYKKFEHENFKIDDDTCMILGSFNKATNTREMIKNIVHEKKWFNLEKINQNIINSINNYVFSDKNLKIFYEEYLDELRKISDKIVPDKQHEILKNTFKFPIIGCGTSGSGGEDCVWCLVKKENLEDILSFWQKNFTYTKVFYNLNGKAKIFNII